MKKHGSYTIYLLALALAVSAASCSGGNPAPAPAATQAAVTETPVSVTETEETDATEDTAESADTSPVETTELPDEVTPKAADASVISSDGGDAAETSAAEDEGDVTEDTTSQPAETAAATSATETAAQESAADTSAAATTVTTTATTTATTTTAESTTTTAATTKAAAQPSPPQISKVSSPGTNVFSSDTAVFDYSNCSAGYVSVDYKGSTRLKMLLKLGESQFSYDIYPAKGAQYFTLAQGSGSYTAELYEMVDNGKFVKLFGETFNVKITDEVGMFTYKNQFVNFDADSACVAKASEVCAGCTSNLEKIAAVFKYVTDNITYDKALAASVTSGYIPDPDSVLSKKKGICFDYASLTAAMLRSQGVPTRLIIGNASPNIYHAWNEVYTPEKGWITAEIALDGSGFRRIDATFYASASDKQNFADYIAKSGNYLDVYVY